jgi:HEPN domain-containing protein
MDAEIVREWLGHVDDDLDAAWSCIRGPRASPKRAAYHVQQAAEKLLKAVLVAFGVSPPRTHDIEELSVLMPGETPNRERLRRLRRFTVFAFAFRYPGEDVPEPEPTHQEIDIWINELTELKAEFVRWLEQTDGGATRG